MIFFQRLFTRACSRQCNTHNQSIKRLTAALLLMMVSSVSFAEAPIAITLHGGAGTIDKSKMTVELRTAYETVLAEALDVGYSSLKAGEDGEQAVIKAIKILEDSPLFNAGVGAVYTYDGEHELDASIMNGRDKNAGAVAGVKRIKNPIEAAYLVMTESVHVMLSAEGAETFAFQHGLQAVDNSSFNTERRFKALERAKKNIKDTSASMYNLTDSNDSTMLSQQSNHLGTDELGSDLRFGTVGVVVLDKNGNIVAGTSTGGMTAKRYGRIGDSPIIGAGTYADNESCGVSATGHGEFFIRYNVAATICNRMKFANETLEQASDYVINQELASVGGDGGVVAVDYLGNVAMPFNTSGMYRAKIDAKGNREIAIFK